ncbi:MAG: membrane protein insertion efficiency factor YidD [Candidatus Merdivicinus sp.]|jgi:putative membrane protein insertion efficiency factor
MKQLLMGFVRFYQKYLSRMKAPCCRFYPTCSAYMLTSLERFGVLKGSILGIWRILRCNPFCAGGIDPVPETFHLPRWKLPRTSKKTRDD